MECPKEFEHLLGPARPGEEGKPRKIWKTKLAEPYPHEFCEDMADMLIKHPKLEIGVGRKPELESVTPPSRPRSAAGEAWQRPPRQHYLTHFPKHPGCETCQLAKAQKKRCARVKHTNDEKSANRQPQVFGDLITADHVNHIQMKHEAC